MDIIRVAPNKVVFSQEEHEFIRNNYEHMTNKELADALGKRLTRLRMEMYSLGLKRMELEYWTPEQVEYLKANYRTIGDTEIAQHFNVTYHKAKGWTKKHIEKKRRYLKLKRTGEEKKSIHARNVRNGSFAMCAVNAWKTREVTEVGATKTWTVNGYVRQFIKTEKGYYPYNRYLWEQKYGPIPKGTNVCYKDGNPNNCVIENLELLTNAESAIKNSKNRKYYPEEIRELHKLLNKLNRKIKSYGTQQDE